MSHDDCLKFVPMCRSKKRPAIQMLPVSFFLEGDVVSISRRLLGCRLCTCIRDDGGAAPSLRDRLTGGIIVETEAYAGSRDRASHAYGNRRTSRTEIMFSRGGVAYVYLCYGVHCLFNIVTNVEGIPDAILIRAIEPTMGIELMMRRRKKSALDHSLTAGPGAVCRALGIGLRHSGTSLNGPEIWLERAMRVAPSRIKSGPRIGVHYAGRDALLPWRFRIGDNPWTSRAS